MLLATTSILILPFAVWATISLVTTIMSITTGPVSISFRLHAKEVATDSFTFRELPLALSLCILGLTALIVHQLFRRRV